MLFHRKGRGFAPLISRKFFWQQQGNLEGFNQQMSPVLFLSKLFDRKIFLVSCGYKEKESKNGRLGFRFKEGEKEVI
jgi:hypothetical protein